MYLEFRILICLMCLSSSLGIDPTHSKISEIGKCLTSPITENSIIVPKFLLQKSTSTTTDRTNTSQALLRLFPRIVSLDCNDTFTLEVILNPKENASFSQPTLLTNGYLKYGQRNYSPDEFCVQSKSESTLTLRICNLNKDCSSSNPCIRKCCDINEVLDLSQFSSKGRLLCRQVNETAWSPQLYKDPYTKIATNVKINFLSQHPTSFCQEHVTLMTLRPFAAQDISPFRIMDDGLIIEKMGRSGWTSVPSDQTCVDGAQNFPLDDTDDSSLSGLYSGDEKDTVIIDCRSFVFAERDEQNEKFTEVYVTALIVAIIFLILTILAHIILWRKQTIRGWTLMAYVTFLAVEFGFLIFARLINVNGISCTTAAIGTHFSALATFSWLTVMNFDVWWSFRTMTPCTTKKEQLKMFIWYAAFATAIPVCIVTLGLILENIYGGDPFSDVIVPEYGKARCGLGTSADFPYLFGPISFLLSSNLVFLAVTLYYIYKHKKILKSNGIKTKILNDKIQFFGMLFLVAGVTWIFEVISWANTPTNAATPWYWMFFDFVNIFQAIAIFLVFVCNRTTRRHLEKEIPLLSTFKLLWSKSANNDTHPQTHEKANDDRKLSITQIFSVTEDGKNHVELK